MVDLNVAEMLQKSYKKATKKLKKFDEKMLKKVAVLLRFLAKNVFFVAEKKTGKTAPRLMIRRLWRLRGVKKC